MLLSLLEKRRSIRQFKAEPVAAEKVGQLIEAALRAPSSRGRNPWHFVVVDQPQLLAGLAKAKAHGAEFLAGAPLAIVVCAEPEICDVWIEDCAIAAIILQLTAESLGLASCWAQMRLRSRADGTSSEVYIKEFLGLPENWAVDCIIGIGTAQRRLPGHDRASLAFGKIHRNGYTSR